MRVSIVFVDANVLYSKTLRDWLFLLREETRGEVFTVAASNDVIAEVLYRIRKRNADGPGYLISRVKELLERQIDEMVRDFPARMAFPGGDVHDRHVHAAAITCGAAYLITQDLGFHEVADQLAYEVHTADSFFQLVAENVPHIVDQVILRQIEYRSRRGQQWTLGEALVAAGCPQFAEVVNGRLQSTAGGPPNTGLLPGRIP